MHLTTEIAHDLLEELLSKALKQQWMTHVDSCSSCSVEWAAWQQIRASLQRSHLQSAPHRVVAAAIDIFQTGGKPAPSKGSSIRQILASLVFDSFTQPAFAGARGETAARQLVLRADEFDIHIRISSTTQNRELMGQIQPRGTNTFVNSARLHLVRDGERIDSAEANEMGEFQFRFVPYGSLNLQIDLPHLTVVGALDSKGRD